MSVWNDEKFFEVGNEMFNPFNKNSVQPASYDLTMGNDFAILRDDIEFYYDVKTRSYYDKKTLQKINPWLKPTVEDDEPFILMPNQFALGTTLEYVTIPLNVIGRVEGKSSLGRIGLMVHVTAGYIDPGFEGQITMEFKNISSCPIQLLPGIPIGQISIHTMENPSLRPYGSYGNHYQFQKGATPPR